MFGLWGIRKNILFLVLTPTLLVSLFLSSYFVTDRFKTLEHSQLIKNKALITSMSLVSESLSVDSPQTLLEQLAKFRDSDPDILAIAISSGDNNFLVKSGNDRFLELLKINVLPTAFQQNNAGDYLQLKAPAKLKGTDDVFYLSAVINQQPLILEQYHTIMMATLIALSILSLSMYIAVHLSRTVGEPLQKIAEELEAINEGDLDIKVHTPEIPELAKISNTINLLAESLQSAKNNMQQNVDQATADLTQTLETIEIQNIELDLARKQAIRASRVKSEFLANISHEIRTPMNGVIGFTNLLLNSDIDVTQKDYLLTIRKSANTLLSIIEDILDFSKIEAGKMSLDKHSYSLRDCVEEVITMLSPSSIKKNIELIPLIYKEIPEQLLGDPIRIRQVLTNLVSNAIKFTEKGSIVVRVMLEEDDGLTQIIRTTITDTGIGMTDEQMSKLFKPFSQVNQQINRHHSGTGLGLVICKKLVEQMGGDITVESKSNEGTSFSFTMKSEKINTPDTTGILPLDLSSLPALIYDHHPMALLSLKQLLGSWNIEVQDFQSLDKLINELTIKAEVQEYRPVIMIGITESTSLMIEQIEFLCRFKNKGIYILGNFNNPSEIEKFKSAGADQYLEKPLTRKQIKKSFIESGIILKNEKKIEYESNNNHQFSQLRILAVDDNPANLKLITIILEEMSIDVIQAYDGLSAIEICKEKEFDLIFMDIRMPGLDGIETTERIREDGINTRTPIIALTAHALASEKENLLLSGLEDCMTKPVNTRKLKQIISKWTGQIAKETERKEHLTDSKLRSNKTEQKVQTDMNSSNNNSIDWTACLNITGGREVLAKEMLADLVSSIPEFKKQLEKLTVDDRDEKYIEKVHKLHGLACYTGVPLLKKLTADLESHLKSSESRETISKVHSELMRELSNIETSSAYYLDSRFQT